MKRRQPEAILHAQVAAYLRVALAPQVVWTTFPAGGGGKVRGAKLRQAGLRAGWPDIQILYPAFIPGRVGPLTRFLGIELKSAKGRVSPEQRECIDLLRNVGGVVYVCRSVDDVAEACRCFGVPLRAKVTA